MNWVRFGSAGTALGVHIAVLGLFVLSAAHEPDLSALQSGSGDDDLTIVATITMQSEDSLGLDAASVRRQDASLGGQAAPEVQEGSRRRRRNSSFRPRRRLNLLRWKAARKKDCRAEARGPGARQRGAGRPARRHARLRSPAERGAVALQQPALSGLDEERLAPKDHAEGARRA